MVKWITRNFGRSTVQDVISDDAAACVDFCSMLTKETIDELYSIGHGISLREAGMKAVEAAERLKGGR